MSNIKMKKSTGFFPWFIWAIAASFFFIQYIARVSPSVMVPDLMRHFSIAAYSVGALSAFFYYAYVPMQLPVGMLVDRYGAKKLLIVAALLAFLGCIFFANTNSLYAAYAARFLMGFGASFSFIGAVKLASMWFPSNRLGMLVGSTQALGMLGAVVGEAPIAFLLPHIGWRYTMMVIGVLFLILAILIIFFIKNSPSKRLENTETKRASLWYSLTTVLKNKQSWLNAIYAGTVYAPIAAFGELWGVSTLTQLYHLSTEKAAMCVSLIFIGWAIGSPIIGIVSDRMGKRRPLMFISSIFSFIFLGAIFYVPNQPLFLLFVELFLFGLCNSGLSISYTIAGEQNPHSIAVTSVSFANMASVALGAAFQPLIGWFLDLRWTGEIYHNARVFSSADYRWAMSILVVSLVISFFVAFFIKETHCKNVHEI